MDKQLSNKYGLQFLNKEQEDCYNEIYLNNSILILKRRHVGTTSVLKKYVTEELLKGKNKTIFYMSPLAITNRSFKIDVSKLVTAISEYECKSSTNKIVIESNNNKLLCLNNKPDSFRDLQQINTFIYDEIGFDRDNFDAWIKTLELYKQFFPLNQLKIIFTYTMEESGKQTHPCNNMVWQWLLTNDFKKVTMTEMLNLKEL